MCQNPRLPWELVDSWLRTLLLDPGLFSDWGQLTSDSWGLPGVSPNLGGWGVNSPGADPPVGPTPRVDSRAENLEGGLRDGLPFFL